MENILFTLLALLSVSFRLYAQDIIKIGIIGFDTFHSAAFTELLNRGSGDKFVREFEAVAACLYGSKTIQFSYKQIPGYIEEVKRHGMEITSSIVKLLDKVDCVMLGTNNGRIHPEQAMEVFKFGKTCYIDRPTGAMLEQIIAIYKAVEKYNVSIFSSSAPRYSPQDQKLRNREFGRTLEADCYSPHKAEPTHPDLGFYGIYEIKTLYILMGTGCELVSRMSSQDIDVVVGRRKDGRIGTFRGTKEGPVIYGGTTYTPKGSIAAGRYEGYRVLLDQILTFFKTGVVLILKGETTEIFTFMKAPSMSKEQNGKIVTMEGAYQKGLKDAQKLTKAYK